MSDRMRDLAFNELSEALQAEDRWVPLTGRQRIADRLVALVRAETAANLRRAAAGRREYAERIPEQKAGESSPNPSLADMRETLLAEAACYESAALIAEDPKHLMGPVPSRRWTDDEAASLYLPKEAADG